MSVNLRVNVGENLKALLDLIENLNAVVVLAKLELLLSLCYLKDEHCIIFA